MNRVIHFDIQVDEPERAIKFYQDVFGWTIEKWDSPVMEYWMVMTAPQGSTEAGISGGLMRRSVPGSAVGVGANAFVCTVMVENFDETAKKIEVAGGKVAQPKFALPKMAWQGYFLDTENNVFGVHQADENAE